jgi:hypothetical protein
MVKLRTGSLREVLNEFRLRTLQCVKRSRHVAHREGGGEEK